ncbi:hypothetical protein H2198_005405 [Neophaeococcomyces mojaviensis]|uniref:Uncharacterized protein n=1 Tax=Neophaeococcomyces mojaviensis TaxID=3383035 RepID=A0ACC3A5Q3_9EURO|nr:hypothetical protein H2198_005405 [Knufia sp. JES_112]
MADNSVTSKSADHSEQEDFEDAPDTSSRPQSPSKPNVSNEQPPSPLSDGASSRIRPQSGESAVSELGKEDHVVTTAATAQVATAVPVFRTRTQSQVSNVSEQKRKSSATAEQTEHLSAKSRSQSIDQREVAVKDLPMKPPPRPSRFPNFSASLPSVPWATQSKPTNVRSPSPQPPPKDPPAPAKRNTAFGWLSRATTASKDTSKSPPLPPLPPKPPADRRGTTASLSTLGSSQDLMLKAIDEGQENGGRNPARNSLKERFKLLRMREEVGISNHEDAESSEGGAVASPTGRSTSLSIGVASTGPVAYDKDPGPMSPALQIPPSPAPTIDNNLAPGTVSGFSVAAVDSAVPIDWDFWQTVVNEGPQAVARTSPEELTAAIASGIPATIRGVIWQVLASSKNEDLEAVYYELKVRGTKDEIPLAASPPPGPPSQDTKEKESTVSSRSSVRSEQSTPATSTNVPISPPSPPQEPIDSTKDAKAQAQVAADRAQRAKEDATALVKLEKMIRRDMGSRTSYSKYAAAAGFQDGLFNVCKAYALFDEGVGYPQGMNFIIMPMLFTMPEEEAFCLLVRLMNRYQLRELFIQDMPGLHLHLYQFERLLEDLEPALYCHLNRRGVTPKLYATQWFLTLFAYRLPLQLVMRVFDLILCEGLEGAILKFGMALMQKNVVTLLEMNDMQALTNYLKEKLFDVYIDASPTSKSILESGFFGSSGGSENDIYRADLLVQDACSVKLTPEMLTRYTTEWEEKTKAEKARETELENLRTDTATKAAQIKSLEKRAEKSDAEHIEIANELVKLKVENQDLIDENETLKGQVEELRKVAASEAANVEERMREGTEKVMQRNIEVQNENRHMEEQMAEMEKELVEMKMKYAELNADHEALKQRWTDLRKAIE